MGDERRLAGCPPSCATAARPRASTPGRVIVPYSCGSQPYGGMDERIGRGVRSVLPPATKTAMCGPSTRWALVAGWWRHEREQIKPSQYVGRQLFVPERRPSQPSISLDIYIYIYVLTILKHRTNTYFKRQDEIKFSPLKLPLIFKNKNTTLSPLFIAKSP